ncbi:Clp protease N-terminal domain-containing protein [Micromonospora sp. NPDC048170]|uniref:Clp protease N-terminal domain-containing protein n=1 Tax=Micromonospora sp. NPDC048170 TaxID=3154819 RepID=UPI0033CA45B9
MALANEQARLSPAGQVDTRHLLLGLIGVRGVAAGLLESLGVSFTMLRRQLADLGPVTPASDPGPHSTGLREVFTLSWQEAVAVGDNSVATQHLLLGLLRQNGAVADILTMLGADYECIFNNAYRHCTVFAHHGRPQAGREPTVEELVRPPVQQGRLALPSQTEDFRQRLAAVRARKEAAIDAQDYEAAAAIRDDEKRLLKQRQELFTAWAADIEVSRLVEEIEQLYQQVDRLEAERRHHRDQE